MILRRRRDYLERMIAEDPEGGLSWDKAEKSALDWAIETLESNGLSDDDRIVCHYCGKKYPPDKLDRHRERCEMEYERAG
ncbi:hypothetical protein HWC80_gp065 [Mycobacterium phage Indlulamithi]|uniref:Uncharacterized protein n=1 Tax=Mycobacterium phage Indlulamithi TaxID=2656582 RepID=A0A649VCV9_9CAUD|nr:hypothetical protein HWC80_gp065 [Mycobacterium phage Indlulamithi]QGJ90146.1 hypothetical protein PBI_INDLULAMITHI_109 [Mycobacterium phage Indlulamithi]